MEMKFENHETVLRNVIRGAHLADEEKAIQTLTDYLSMSENTREALVSDAADLVRQLRRAKNPGLMETFLGEYGLSTEEGVALMCLAEALLRVPDDSTIDMLISDKIAPADWGQHLGHSTSPLVNASTWALMLTGKVISPKETENWDVVSNIKHLIKRAGEPVIRKAVAQSMKILGHQFVLGRDISEAMQRAKGMEDKGYQYSYDMLGEAARTAKDARKYFLSYSRAIARLSEAAYHSDIRDNPGISIKLSALHPRYEFLQKERVLEELVPRVLSLAEQAKNAQMGFNIDAEEADRLDLSLDVIEAVFSQKDLRGWDGFGVVVQAYSPRAFYVLDWCYNLAKRLNRRIMVRLVKGAYWDTEIKLAQVEGLPGYPVFTKKAATDVSYMACAKKLLSMTDHVYPQFATHNAYSMTAIMALAGDERNFEFQRLHGMGEGLHDIVKKENSTRCRIYAPVGVHEDLLAYLVRRLLENGANSSFVNQVLDEKVPARDVVRDPISLLDGVTEHSTFKLPAPKNIFPDGRINSDGMNLSDPAVLDEFLSKRAQFEGKQWTAGPILNGTEEVGEAQAVINPADLQDSVGHVSSATLEQVENAVQIAIAGQVAWARRHATERSQILRQIADLYEENRVELMTILGREAGKSLLDGLSEVREAVDFCRFYANEAEKEALSASGDALGVFVCISPWNFPLAIFTGQIVAALVTGNAVLAKPAEQTPLIASFAARLMLKAGVPDDVLQLVPGAGQLIGNALVSRPDIAGVCFTGSTDTAKVICRAMADQGAAYAPFIAETGGINAMVVDSTALPEQAVRDIVASAFQSAGQRCSALRVLYVQEDVAERTISMLKGAMDELIIGNPLNIDIDAGPVIDTKAKQNIETYCAAMEEKGALLKKVLPNDAVASSGHYVAASLFRINGIHELEREVFGPVLHVATYKADQVEQVIDAINNTGFGLTMGLHTRVDGRVQSFAEKAKVGNLYVNRNQIGAVVGVQPFGGEGLSGTGPKAGGPLYLHRFVGKKIKIGSTQETSLRMGKAPSSPLALPSLPGTALAKWQLHPDRRTAILSVAQSLAKSTAFDSSGFEKKAKDFDQDIMLLPGPTGESNQLQFHARGTIFVMGDDWMRDCLLALMVGNRVIVQAPQADFDIMLRALSLYSVPDALITRVPSEQVENVVRELKGLSSCALSGGALNAKQMRIWLSERTGPIVSLLDGAKGWREFAAERTLSIDTTASGGNAALLAAVDG
ncbi:bifunctional proline dehydrogenase/L-glutamate gamma-semialdehyde dehydrogenase PutA [Sneathiella aquimaris]|uniref:bifunctional proline dehydrogenase/L-glutamate gamma-semialdehyde dehydrogenase PutA n=1 Tax=Sneathiella aquimaris TaxID=2599305 RepID=UPI001CA57491|nr:bifunctional proline dehydrogenase/L-glutamate gamma-semialdehyde dehydrogenase PutA [Sneathiella aquimaris]